MIKTIEVVISPAGETKIQTKGFTGSACQDASRFVEEALGTRSSERLTAEFYQQQSTSQSSSESQRA